MKRTAIHAGRTKSLSSLPADLVGDWESGGIRYRFHGDGTYSLYVPQNYSIDNDVTLNYSGETYSRVNGSTGLPGVWRLEFGSGERLDVTLGFYSFYSFLWNNGDTGGGYYSATDDELALIEKRATVECVGDQITFTSPNGTEAGTFVITNDVLVITFPKQVVEYVRVPLWD